MPRPHVQHLSRAAVALTGLATIAAGCGTSPGSSASTTTRPPPATTTPTTGGSTGAGPATTTTVAPAGTTTTTAATSGTVLLGATTAGTVGFGTARPPRIDLGGDPTGDVSTITWQSWGGSEAVGAGTSYWVPPGDPTVDAVQAPATVVAYGLGTCGAGPAYTRLVWYFPTHGETRTTTGNSVIDACDARA